MLINYINCKTKDGDSIIRSIECFYIPHLYYKGLIIHTFSGLSLIFEIAFFIIIIM